MVELLGRHPGKLVEYPNVQITGNKTKAQKCARSKTYTLKKLYDCITDSYHWQSVIKPLVEHANDEINRWGRLGEK